jgi:hypothetical protein
MSKRQIIIIPVIIFLISFSPDLSSSSFVSVLGTEKAGSIFKEYDSKTTDDSYDKFPFYNYGAFEVNDFYYDCHTLIGKATPPFRFGGTKYSLHTENRDNQRSGQSPDQFADVSKEKLNLRFSASVDPCQGIIRHFKDSIEEIRWLDDTTLVVKVYVIITCQNKIENIDYEFINDRIILKFQEVGNSMANCVCAHNVIYNFTNLRKREYKLELIKIK